MKNDYGNVLLTYNVAGFGAARCNTRPRASVRRLGSGVCQPSTKVKEEGASCTYWPGGLTYVLLRAW